MNHKRIDRRYTDEKLQPKNRHEIWPTDFAFDPSAGNRVIKCLTVANDANHEAVTIRPERALSGLAVTSILDDLAITRHRPTVIRTDNVLDAMGSRTSLNMAQHQPCKSGGVHIRHPVLTCPASSDVD